MDRDPIAVRSRVGLPILAARTEVERPLGYYDIPFLKRPTWEWHIAAYFFLESISSGALLIASISDVVGAKSSALRRAGYLVSFASFLPCPPLLIADLGRPERFHHMLRMLKPTSPMSHGSWALAAYSVPMAALTADTVAELLPARFGVVKRLAGLVPRRPLAGGGIPCALMLATYPGVLLATTANPLWSRGRTLGALFAASAVHAGASAVSIALAIRGGHSDERARLDRIERVASAAEATALAAFLVAAGRHARPLLAGRQRTWFWLGAVGVGLALPALLKALAPRGRLGRLVKIAGAALSLAGAFAMKWAILHAGRDAAADARASHEAALPGDRDGQTSVERTLGLR